MAMVAGYTAVRHATERLEGGKATFIFNYLDVR